MKWMTLGLLLPLFALSQSQTQNVAETIEETRRKAEAGSSTSQSKLGQIYFNGNVVQRDYTKAGEWFRKAANRGDSTAEYMLGQMYYFGDRYFSGGLPRDFAKAMEWCRKAADQGNTDGQLILGRMYSFGEAYLKTTPKGGNGSSRPRVRTMQLRSSWLGCSTSTESACRPII